MATGTSSAAPDTPVGSSPLRKSALSALVGWLKEISDFIRSLSPTGATAFDELEDFSLSDTSNFELYSGASRLQVRRYGRVVELWGTVACTTAGYVGSNTERVFATIPDGFRPRGLQRVIMPGANSANWLLKVSANGNLVASNHTGTQPAGAWMPINLTYLTA